jgi:hypothetical protein
MTGAGLEFRRRVCASLRRVESGNATGNPDAAISPAASRNIATFAGSK